MDDAKVILLKKLTKQTRKKSKIKNMVSEEVSCQVPTIHFTPSSNLPTDPWYNDLRQNPSHTKLVNYKDVEFLIIRNSWSGALLAYINFKRKKNLYPDTEDFEEKIHVHGGITAGCNYFIDKHGFGMDFMHFNDRYPNGISSFGSGSGKYWSFDDVQKHCEEIIDECYKQFN